MGGLSDKWVVTVVDGGAKKRPITILLKACILETPSHTGLAPQRSWRMAIATAFPQCSYGGHTQPVCQAEPESSI